MRLEQFTQKKAAEQLRKSTQQQPRDISQQPRDTTEEAEELEDPGEREEPANSSEQGTDKEDKKLSDPEKGITEREEDNVEGSPLQRCVSDAVDHFYHGYQADLVSYRPKSFAPIGIPSSRGNKTSQQ
jgi:FtsZ-interacting cell division protein ZipA